MAVPKGKVSRSRRDKRRANWKATLPTTTTCKQCGATKLTHTVCEACGYYDKDKKASKKEVAVVEQDEE